MGQGGYRQINKTLNVCAFDEYLSKQQASLPELEDVTRLSPRVIRVLGQNPGKFTLQGTNTYIVGTGAQRLIIDTGQGFPEWADLTSSALEAADTTLSHIFLTHWHGDHTGGVGDLLQRFPHLSGAVFKNTPGKGQQPIEDGQRFSVEGATIRAVHAPGHSHDHMCFVLEEENAMFTGDNVLGHGTSAVEELSVYMSTLRTMQSHECTVGYPAHGAMIPNLRGKIASELAQKLARERQILQTLHRIRRHRESSSSSYNNSSDGTSSAADGIGARTGRVTVKELVTAMHGEGIDEQVREMALEPFMDEVLRKLAEDGRVGFEVRGGVKKWFGVDEEP